MRENFNAIREGRSLRSSHKMPSLDRIQRLIQKKKDKKKVKHISKGM